MESEVTLAAAYFDANSFWNKSAQLLTGGAQLLVWQRLLF
jgi:hypothetical protein